MDIFLCFLNLSFPDNFSMIILLRSANMESTWITPSPLRTYSLNLDDILISVSSLFTHAPLISNQRFVSCDRCVTQYFSMFASSSTVYSRVPITKNVLTQFGRHSISVSSLFTHAPLISNKSVSLSCVECDAVFHYFLVIITSTTVRVASH